MTIDADDRPRTRPWNRRAVSLVVPGAILVVLLVVAPDVPLLIFAGVLVAVLLGAGGGWIARRVGLPRRVGIGLFVVLIIVAFAGLFIAFVPAIVEQANAFAEQAPAAIEALRERISGMPWLERLLARASPSALVSGEGGAMAAGAVTSTFGALGNVVIVLFIGLFGALDPGTYRDGARILLAPSLRARAREVLDEVGETLRGWLTAQLIAMAVVGIVTGLGLWAIGLPLAFLLGLIAGLLAFIPTLGPVIAAAPAILLAAPEGWQTVLLVVAVFAAVQALESYAITPLLQQRTASLPPALIIAAQLLMGVLFGLIGLMLATPLAAAAMTLTRAVYVDDYLDHEGPRD